MRAEKKKDIAQDSVLINDRKEEIREQGSARASKERARCSKNSGTVRRIVGTQAKATEAMDEHESNVGWEDMTERRGSKRSSMYGGGMLLGRIGHRKPWSTPRDE